MFKLIEMTCMGPIAQGDRPHVVASKFKEELEQVLQECTKEPPACEGLDPEVT